MALGFGFNKAKVLSAAEKFVQQGKLQNAISEYEKVIKEDPKDLTVLNAIGDLYHRVGQNDKAAEYFRKVGDQYAQNGFTVKAIAVYKKLTRVSTSSESAIKLAELYTQQGLFNDARTHYMQVADQLLKSGDNNQAARVFQKILELDPENTTTQSKLADLYIKLGKKEDARNIYYSAAESLYARKALDAADEALNRVLSIEPENSKALLLRGMIAADSGDSSAAVQYLAQVPDLDSNPGALRSLLQAKLQTNLADGAEPLAMKLFKLHQDVSGLAALAEWMGTHHREEEALNLYDQYADRFFAQGQPSVVATLYPLISRVRNNPPGLERMLRLLQKAGDTSHVNEVMELLAHAKVQSGDFAQARDLYKELAEAEPENPLHTQNYRQMLSKLGEDSVSRPLTTEESGQALMVEELEHAAPAVHQEYAPTVEKAIEAALTDAELFVSYNVPLKAIAPLETVLPIAPHDLRLNQRLASLYLRAGRFADAVRTCKILSELYAGFGYPAEAERYAEEAQKYASRAPGENITFAKPVAPTPVSEPEPRLPVAEPALPVYQEPGTATVKEFVLDVPGEEFFESPPAETTPAIPQEAVAQDAAINDFAVEAVTEAPPEPVPLAATPEEIEIDVSHEWESMLTVESEPATAEQSQPAISGAVITSLPAALEELAPEPIVPVVEVAPIPPVTVVSPVPPAQLPPVSILKAPVPLPTPIPKTPVIAPPKPPLPVVEAVAAPPVTVVSPTVPIPPPAPIPKTPVIAPPKPPLPVVEAVAAPPVTVVSPTVPIPPPVVSPPASVTQPKVPVSAPPQAAPVVPSPDHAVIEDKIQEIRFYISQGFWDMARAALHDLSEMAPDTFLLDELRAATSAGEAAAAAAVKKSSVPAASAPPPRVPAPPPPQPIAVAPPTRPVQVPPPEEEFFLELEDEPSPPVKAKTVAPAFPSPPPKPAPEPMPAAVPPARAHKDEDILGDLVSDLEDSLGDFIPGGASQPEPKPVHAASVAPATSQSSLVSSVVQAAASADTNGAMHNAEATSVLSDILSELQQDLEEDTVEAEDSETHYNLGIAFKEMGLLDEAIGELQKVCHALERGNNFSQAVQAYTWLAQCLVDKGVPEAAVRWYQRALHLPGLDQGSRCAIYYDIGSAYEASGDKKSALANFMEVYGSNIDFRDVASRIKVLKS